MDFVNKLTGGNKAEGQQATTQGQQQESSSSGGGFMDKLNGMAGGGKESEKNEDGLDKGKSCTSPRILSCADVDYHSRCRLGPGACPRPGPAEQRERRRAGQGRADLRLHSRPVQEDHG